MAKGFPDSFLLTSALRFKRDLQRGLGRRRRRGGTVLYYKLVNLVLFKPIIQFELRGRYGTVDRHLHRIGNRIQQRAKRQVGVKTGRLRASIVMKHETQRGERAVRVGGYTSYALLHHQGTRPHIITPNKPGGNLVFRSGSRIIHTKIVRHPGTRANRYLTDQLRKERFR
jgi:hypothetical protein